MYDIIFYYKQGFPKDDLAKLIQKYPLCQTIQIGSDPNFVTYAKKLLSNTKTSMVWMIPAGIGISKQITSYTVPTWDSKYVHHQKIRDLDVFLIPKSHVFTDDQFDQKFFNEVKFVDYGIFYTYDIFFLSYKEENADANYKKLLKIVPYAKRVQGVKGIFNAHLTAAMSSTTDFFWVVDADAIIAENFKFAYEVPSWDFDVVHIWRSKNQVNNLIYGNGGVKLLPKHLLLDADPESVDVTTSLSNNIKIQDEVSNYNDFATSPFNAWRGAFRECAKLASASINRQVQLETDARLEAWCTQGADTQYGKYVIAGALAGKEYGTAHKRNPVDLKKINDWIWLEQQFNVLLNSHSLEK
jgi:hypothetical protein